MIKYGILAITYIHTVSCVLENSICLYGALEGLKFENIENNIKVLFCVVGVTKTLSDEFTTNYQSVVLFGKAYNVSKEKRKVIFMEFLKIFCRLYKNTICQINNYREVKMLINENKNKGIIKLNKDGKIKYIDHSILNIINKEYFKKNIWPVLNEDIFDSKDKITNRLIHFENKEFLITKIEINEDIILIMQNSELLYGLRDSSEYNLDRQIDFLFKVMDNENDVTITDNKGTILKVSDSYEKNYDITKDEVIGRSVFELEKQGIFSPSVTSVVIKEKRKATLMQKNKIGKRILTTGVPIFNDNNEIKYIVSFNSIDIADLTSTREKYEKLKQFMDKYYNELNEIKLKEIERTGIIAKSSAMKNILKFIINISDVNVNVLITGETGVGKSLLAKLINQKSERLRGRFIEISCGSIPENLIESELFGYTEGSFTGANKEGKVGKIEMADGGILFLDEIGELSLNMQKKLLQVIQEKKIMKIGDNKYTDVNFRLISATNKDLSKQVEKGEFREDLFYRLNVLPIHVPPLRERKEDILPLILYFLNKNNKKYNKKKSISQKAIDKLINHDWFGNIRELENIIERLVITTVEKNIDLNNIPEYIRKKSICYDDKKTLKEMTETFEREIIIKAYERYNNTIKMAEALGISQSTVVRKLQKYIEKY